MTQQNNITILTELEKELIFHLFWERGFVHWTYENISILGGDPSQLMAEWKSGSETTVIGDIDRERFKLRAQAAKDYAANLERGLRNTLERLGRES